MFVFLVMLILVTGATFAMSLYAKQASEAVREALVSTFETKAVHEARQETNNAYLMLRFLAHTHGGAIKIPLARLSQLPPVEEYRLQIDHNSVENCIVLRVIKTKEVPDARSPQSGSPSVTVGRDTEHA
jgi:hypothetical protein